MGIPLDMMTITIAAITIRIAVDNSIHYIYRFREEFKNYKNYKNNKKVINLAKRVEKQSNIYKKQLSDCKNSLSTNKYIIF